MPEQLWITIEQLWIACVFLAPTVASGAQLAAMYTQQTRPSACAHLNIPLVDDGCAGVLMQLVWLLLMDLETRCFSGCRLAAGLLCPCSMAGSDMTMCHKRVYYSACTPP